MKVEIETTIRNGLPVMARGNFVPGAKPLAMQGEARGVWCPGWGDGVEDIEIYWRKKPRTPSGNSRFGKHVPERLVTRDDEDRIIEQMVREVRDYRSEW